MGAQKVLAASTVIAGLLILLVPAASASPLAGPPLSTQACTPSASNPVVNSTGPFFINSSNGRFFVYTYTYYHPFVMHNGSGYTMWMTGDHQTNTSLNQGIYTANSRDGLHWTVRPDPVLAEGPKGSWDQGTIYSPWVVWNGSMYLMYFTGVNATVQSRAIGVAFSKDNIHWTEYAGNPIIKGGPGAYDAYWARYPSVIYENGTYKMWYTGHTLITSAGLNVTISYATSSDGVHWTKYVGNPVFKVLYPGTSDTYWSEHGFVASVAGGYIMTYDDEQNISYAYSSNGVNWTRGAYPLLRAPESGTWSNQTVIFSDPLINGSEMLLWYYGVGGPSVIHPATEYTEGIGLALCPLVIVPTTVTTTVVKTSTIVKTSTLVTVSTTTLETSAQVPGASDVPYYQAAVLGLGVAAVSLGLLAVRRQRIR